MWCTRAIFPRLVSIFVNAINCNMGQPYKRTLIGQKAFNSKKRFLYLQQYKYYIQEQSMSSLNALKNNMNICVHVVVVVCTRYSTCTMRRMQFAISKVYLTRWCCAGGRGAVHNDQVPTYANKPKLNNALMLSAKV